MKTSRAAVLAGLLLLPAIQPVHGQELVVMMSTQDVAITSTYTGAKVALFGLIERNAGTIARSGKYEVAVTVTGPSGPIAVREKMRAGPIWINRNMRRYVGVPGFFAVLSSSAIDVTANEGARERLKLGLEHYLPALERSPDETAQDMLTRDAVIRLRKENALYVADPRAVVMPRPNIFNAQIPLPASSPTGRYIVAVSLFSEGVPLTTSNTSFIVRKVGFEAFTAQSARDHGWIYGLAMAAMAVFFGVLGNIIFRRD